MYTVQNNFMGFRVVSHIFDIYPTTYRLPTWLEIYLQKSYLHLTPNPRMIP